MSDMDKVRDEMAKTKNPAVSAIGEYVTERIAEGASIRDGRTLEGAYMAMYDWAKKHKSGSGVAVVTPEQAYSIVNEYYGFAPRGQAEAQSHRAEVKPVMDDELDLDALLGGL